MKHRLLIAMVGVSAVGSLLAEPEIKGSPQELSAYLAGLPRIVSVIGEAEVKVAADRATVSLRIRTENKSLQEALRWNQEIREKVKGFLVERGIETERVQSSRFGSAQRFGIFSEKARSHEVDHFLKVIVRDEKEFHLVVSTIDRWPEVHYGGIQFEHSEQDTLKMKALAQACEKASRRARLFESELAVNLVPRSFREETGLAGRHIERAGEYLGLRSQKTDSTGPASYGISMEDGQSAFGELVFSARVSVEFALENRRSSATEK